MSWDAVAAFVALGGYGAYVWGAYALLALVVALEPWFAARRLQRALRAAAPVEVEAPTEEIAP